MAKKDSQIFYWLVTNKAFVDWVRDPNEERDYFWNKWLEQHPEHADDFKKARKYVKTLRFEDESLDEGELDQLLGDIISKGNTQLQVQRPASTTSGISKHSLLQIAATLLILVATGLMAYLTNLGGIADWGNGGKTQWVEISNPKGKRTTVTLPDGSLVDLNYESTLRYPKKFGKDIRKVELTGEAFFDVRHHDGYPFIVKTNTLETQVFGTSFNINSFPDQEKVAVSLVTGKVQVTQLAHNEGVAPKKLMLVPGEQASFDRLSQKMDKQDFRLEDIIGWKYGLLVFKDVDFAQFVDKIQKWYNVRVKVEGTPPNDWSFNGRYHNEEISNILKGVQFVYGLQYEVDGQQVTLRFDESVD